MKGRVTWIGCSQSFAFYPKWDGVPLGAFEQRSDATCCVLQDHSGSGGGRPGGRKDHISKWMIFLEQHSWILSSTFLWLMRLEESWRFNQHFPPLPLESICPTERVPSEPLSVVQKLTEAGSTLRGSSVVFRGKSASFREEIVAGLRFSYFGQDGWVFTKIHFHYLVNVGLLFPNFPTFLSVRWGHVTEFQEVECELNFCPVQAHTNLLCNLSYSLFPVYWPDIKTSAEYSKALGGDRAILWKVIEWSYWSLPAKQEHPYWTLNEQEINFCCIKPLRFSSWLVSKTALLITNTSQILQRAFISNKTNILPPSVWILVYISICSNLGRGKKVLFINSLNLQQTV